MKPIYMKNYHIINRLMVAVLAGMMSMQDGRTQEDIYNPWNIDDNDTTIYFTNQIGQRIQSITGLIFKAIDPKLVANKHGFTSSESKNKNKFLKDFTLTTFDYVKNPNPYYEDYSTFTPLTMHSNWDYYINDVLIQGYARILASALMPQAIERIEMRPQPEFSHDVSAYREFLQMKGSIRFHTRDISKSLIDDNKTVYILNGQTIITRKIYEAINPVFIRSLNRITDPIEKVKYGRDDINEVVQINLFKIQEVTPIVSSRDGAEYIIYLVDNVQIDYLVYQILNKLYFKEVCEITSEEKKDFAPYRKLFSKMKSKKRHNQVIIISL